jgi:hypothetical protein
VNPEDAEDDQWNIEDDEEGMMKTAGPNQTATLRSCARSAASMSLRAIAFPEQHIAAETDTAQLP